MFNIADVLDKRKRKYSKILENVRITMNVKRKSQEG